MKKILFASTALVAAGMMSAGAASAAEKIKLELGGNATWWVAGVWNDEAYMTRSGATGNAVNVDVKGSNILNFSGSTALDNGLKVGVMITVPAGGHSDSVTDSIDQSYVWMEGGFGKVMAGMHANGTALLHVAAPDAANNYMILGNWAVARPSTVMGMNQRVGYTTSSNNTAITSDDKAEKITYVAPSFYGLTLGASYIPNVARNSSTGLGAHSRGTPTDGLTGWGGGALYANTFGPVGVKASAGYVWVDLQDVANQAANAWTQQAYGASLSYAGFTLGGSYQRASDDRRNGGNTAAALSGTSQVGSIKGGSAVDFGGSAYDVGLQYASGPYAVSFKYYHSSVVGLTDVTTRNGKDDTIDIYQASGKYNLGPGVDVLATVGYAEYKDQRDGTGTALTNPAYSNSGWTAMTGLSLTF
jgi:outer membrane protein OmpU